MARGPIHEAFASPTVEPKPGLLVPKAPPKPIEEMAPEEKPEGEVVWISGYWSYDDDRKDFLWVSGVWRTVPQGRQWVAGYWREEGDQWQWVPGFWAQAPAQEQEAQQVTYLPEPPAPPAVAPPPEPPSPKQFWVPGCYVWSFDHYVWRPGYWETVRPDYVWVAAHYRWTPSGYVYIPGYWDLRMSKRGLMYAPVVIQASVVTPGFVYTPVYAVNDTVVLDAMFVRPYYGSYYFGDYYEARYSTMGFESCVVYSRRSYDPIIVYESYERPTWVNVQINLFNSRRADPALCPPRTLAQQTTIIQNNVTVVQNNTTINNTSINNTSINNTNINSTNINNTNINKVAMLAPATQVAAAKGMKTVKLDTAARTEVRQQAQAVQQVALDRQKSEVPVPKGTPIRPRVSALKVPPTQPPSAKAETSKSIRPASELKSPQAPNWKESKSIQQPNPINSKQGVQSGGQHPEAPKVGQSIAPVGPGQKTSPQPQPPNQGLKNSGQGKVELPGQGTKGAQSPSHPQPPQNLQGQKTPAPPYQGNKNPQPPGTQGQKAPNPPAQNQKTPPSGPQKPGYQDPKYPNYQGQKAPNSGTQKPGYPSQKAPGYQGQGTQYPGYQGQKAPATGYPMPPNQGQKTPAPGNQGQSSSGQGNNRQAPAVTPPPRQPPPQQGQNDSSNKKSSDDKKNQN
jgi:hypothetical protein